MSRRYLANLFKPEIATMLDAGSLFGMLKSYVRRPATSVERQPSTGLSDGWVRPGSHVPTLNVNGLKPAVSQEPDLGCAGFSSLKTKAAFPPIPDPNTHDFYDLPLLFDLKELTSHAKVHPHQSTWDHSQILTTSPQFAPTTCLPHAMSDVHTSGLSGRHLASAPILAKGPIEEKSLSFKIAPSCSARLQNSVESGQAETNATSNSLLDQATKPHVLALFETGAIEQKEFAAFSSTPAALLAGPVKINGIGDAGPSQLDVRAFGAVGDGVTDDSLAIQNAELAASAQGKELFFGPGTYLINEKVYLHSNDALLGTGLSTTLKMGSGLDTIFALNGSPSDQNGNVTPIKNVSISGIQFDGSAPSNPNEGPMIVCYIADGVNFFNDGFNNTNGIGILFSNTENSVVNESSFSNIGNKPLLTNNLLDAAQGIAFCDSSIIKSQNNTVENSSFNAIGLDAISASDQTSFFISKNFMVGLNVISGWDKYSVAAAGVYLTRNDGIVATENYIEGASGNGIDLYDNSNAVISENTVIASGSAGIAISKTSDSLITDNLLENNNQYKGHFICQAGISIIGDGNQSSSNILIQGNRSEDTQTIPTQNYGLQVVPGTPTLNVNMSGNYLGQNAIAPSNIDDSGNQEVINPLRSLPKDFTQFVSGTISLADAGFSAVTPVANVDWIFASPSIQPLGSILASNLQTSSSQLLLHGHDKIAAIQHSDAFL